MEMKMKSSWFSLSFFVPPTGEKENSGSDAILGIDGSLKI
jgi:hypothetical protein